MIVPVSIVRAAARAGALMLLLGAAACQGRQVEDGGVDEDASTGADTSMDAAAPGLDAGGGDAVAGGETAGGATAEVAVTNPMPHAMIVKADWGSGEVELGPVEPGETASFEVGAPPGTQVSLSAADAAETHAVSGSVTVEADAPAAWTIQ